MIKLGFYLAVTEVVVTSFRFEVWISFLAQQEATSQFQAEEWYIHDMYVIKCLTEKTVHKIYRV